jgi:PAS domain S-box-containing protein
MAIKLRPSQLQANPSRPIGIPAAVSLGIWFVMGCVEIVEGLAAAAPIDLATGTAMLIALGPIIALLRRRSDVTEKVAAEQALAAARAEQHEKDAQFKALVSNIPGAVFRCRTDEAWTDVYVSDGIMQLCGYPPSDLVGARVRTWSSVIHPDDREMCERLTRDAVTNRRPVVLAHRILHRDGSVRWVSERAQPVFDDVGRPLYLDGVVFDITEHKAAEAALAATHAELHRSDAQFRSLLSNIPGTVYRSLNDANWTPVFLSGDVNAVSGYTADELLSNRAPSVSKLVHPDDLATVDRGAAAAIAKREPYDLEYRITRRDGRERWVHERGRGVYGEDGSLLHLDGCIFDITERKQAEAALAATHAELRRSDTAFRSLLSNIPGTVYRCVNDADWTPIFLSGDVEAVSGYTADEFLGKRVPAFSKLVHPDDLAALDRAVATAVATRKAYDLEYRITHRDGRERWVHERGRGVYGEDGSLLHLDGCMFDITERKQAEAALAVALENMGASERQFRSLTANLPGAVYRCHLDADWTSVFMSDAMEGSPVTASPS